MGYFVIVSVLDPAVDLRSGVALLAVEKDRRACAVVRCACDDSHNYQSAVASPCIFSFRPCNPCNGKLCRCRLVLWNLHFRDRSVPACRAPDCVHASGVKFGLAEA